MDRLWVVVGVSLVVGHKALAGELANSLKRPCPGGSVEGGNDVAKLPLPLAPKNSVFLAATGRLEASPPIAVGAGELSKAGDFATVKAKQAVPEKNIVPVTSPKEEQAAAAKSLAGFGKPTQSAASEQHPTRRIITAYHTNVPPQMIIVYHHHHKKRSPR